MAYSILTDQEQNMLAMRRQFNQREEKQHTAIKCKSCGSLIEILKPEDQYLECPNCFKRWFLSYSIGRSRIYGE